MRGEGILLNENKVLLCQLTAHFIPSLKVIFLTLAENRPFNYMMLIIFKYTVSPPVKVKIQWLNRLISCDNAKKC